MSTYHLGRRSRQNLVGVHPHLVAVVERAIELTSQDFAVFEGLRSPARQATLLARGVSRTLRSRHLVQPDGYGWAVDIVPYVEGRLDWSDEHLDRYYTGIAPAMRRAAEELGHGHRLQWGGDWSWRDYAHWQLRHVR